MTRDEINRAICEAKGHIAVPFGSSIKICKLCDTRDLSCTRTDWHADMNSPTLWRELIDFYGGPTAWFAVERQTIALADERNTNTNDYSSLWNEAVCLAWLVCKGTV